MCVMVVVYRIKRKALALDLEKSQNNTHNGECPQAKKPKAEQTKGDLLIWWEVL